MIGLVMSINTECTQADLARELGLSQATVSLALAGHPRVSAATRDRVQKVACEMRYRPDPGLQRAVLKRWQGGRRTDRETLAVVLTDDSPMRRAEAEWARKFANQHGYQLDLLSVREYRTPRRLNDILFSRGIRGILVQDSIRSHIEDELDQEHLVVVHVGLKKEHAMLSSVHLNHFRAIHVALRESERLGFKRIGFIVPGWEEGARRLQQAALGLQVQLRHDVEEKRRPASKAEVVGVVHRTHARSAPILCDEVAELMEAEPDAVIGIGLWCRKALQALRLPPRKEPPFAIINPPPNGQAMAGFEPAAPGIMERAIDLLHHRLLDHDFGTPRLPQSITFLPAWQDHSSFVLGRQRRRKRG